MTIMIQNFKNIMLNLERIAAINCPFLEFHFKNIMLNLEQAEILIFAGLKTSIIIKTLFNK